VLDGDPSPPQKGHSRPHFLAHVYCGQTAGWIRMPATWHRGRTRPRPQYVRLGPSCLPKRGTAAPSFRPMSIVAKRLDGLGCQPLGTEVGLGQGHNMLDWDPAVSPKGAQQPSVFGPCLLWPNGMMDQDATWYGNMPWPRRDCVRWGPSPLPQKRGHSPPLFGPCLLWPNGRPSQQLLSSC